MIKRRNFVAGTIPTIALFGLSPAEAGAQAGAQPKELDTFLTFSGAEANTFSAWCEVLVTGAAEAGVARFVDQNISGPFEASMLLLRYLSSKQMSEFYRGGIAGIEHESEHRFSTGFTLLDQSQRREVVEAAVQAKMQAWTTPNPNFFYFISRSDAVDVVYGTQAGFERLDIPYLAHIEPQKPW